MFDKQTIYWYVLKNVSITIKIVLYILLYVTLLEKLVIKFMINIFYIFAEIARD